MSVRIEHFIYGGAAALKRFRATIPAGMEVSMVPGGLVVRDLLRPGRDSEAAIARIEALARAQGLDYDGHGRAVDAGGAGRGLDIQPCTLTHRTGVAAGAGFAVPLPDGRFGHGVYLGGDRRGYLLLDVSALVTDRPAGADAVRDAPRRYRQPLLVWHTGFAALPLARAAPIAQLPCEVVFRSGVGWPDPEAVARLEIRLGVRATDTPEGWNALLAAMAEAGERMPGIDGATLTTARVGRTGALTLSEDHTVVRLADSAAHPMPWQPAAMDDIITGLAGGQDIIAARDRVT